MNSNEEIWKPIPTDVYWQGIKDMYDVSNMGRVRNRNTGKILSARPGRGPQQSYRVSLVGETYKKITLNLSKLVYNAFCDPNHKVRDYSIITFVDGNPANCAFSNLISL